MEVTAIPPIGGNHGGSAGAMRASSHNFMLRVQAAIGPKSLSGHGVTGRVLVAFSIADDGGLMGVRIASSSGHPQLDQQAVQIVGKATLPTPPAGLALVNRTYVSAFTFS